MAVGTWQLAEETLEAVCVPKRNVQHRRPTHIYVLCGDGDSNGGHLDETASLAGTWAWEKADCF